VEQKHCGRGVGKPGEEGSHLVGTRAGWLDSRRRRWLDIQV